MIKRALIALIGLCFLVSFSFIKNANEGAEDNYYSQKNDNRTAAEWEAAKGTLIVWPLSIPYKLVVELAKDNHLYTMLENKKVEKEATEWYQKWGIDLANVTFIYADQGIDAWWTRDWGPSAVFSPDGKMSLGDGKYLYATPGTDLPCNDSLYFYNDVSNYFFNMDKNKKKFFTQTDDDATIPLAEQLNVSLLDLPFVNTGGNVLTDGIGTAFSSCILTSENEFFGVEREEFFRLNDSLLGFKDYHILSNFEFSGIQHIDCLLKLIDEETILVAEPPKDHELYQIYEDIVQNELATLVTPYGRPYEIKRIPTAPTPGDDLAAYTNSFILNKVVYVPTFKIPHDSIALATWRKVMPGYEVKGFTFSLDEEPIVSEEMWDHYTKYGKYGWNSGDALHCRTRAIWDKEMLFISVKKPRRTESAKEPNVYVSLIDYSQQGLIKNKNKIFWRVTGSDKWNESPLNEDGDPHHFRASFPPKIKDDVIEYYIEAQSRSGSVARRPATAPEGYYVY